MSNDIQFNIEGPWREGGVCIPVTVRTKQTMQTPPSLHGPLMLNWMSLDILPLFVLFSLSVGEGAAFPDRVSCWVDFCCWGWKGQWWGQGQVGDRWQEYSGNHGNGWMGGSIQINAFFLYFVSLCQVWSSSISSASHVGLPTLNSLMSTLSFFSLLH